MPEEVPAAAPQLGEVGRLSGVFFSPAETFQAIAHRPSFLAPLIVLTLLSLGVTWWLGYRVGWERLIRSQMEQSERFQQMTAEQREQAVSQAMRFVTVQAYGGGLLGPVVVALIVSGVFLFVFNVLAGNELEFRRVFSVVVWGMMPYALASVLALVIIGLEPPEDVDVQNLVASNLGALLDPDRTSKPLLSLMRSIDLFTIWVLLLLSTGFAASARKLTFQKALRWVALTWLVWVGVKAGYYAIFS